jgi:hypothetical protein
MFGLTVIFNSLWAKFAAGLVTFLPLACGSAVPLPKRLRSGEFA